MIKYLQRKRTKGWSLDKECERLGIKRENVVFCGRGTKWGNPYKICPMLPTKTDVVKEFKDFLDRWEGVWGDDKKDIKKGLKGKTLMCWCSLEDFDNGLCHCSVLSKIVNGGKK